MDNPTPQNKINLSGLAKGGKPANIQIDGKNLLLEHTQSGEYLCRVDAEEATPLQEGINTVWRGDEENWIDILLDSHGSLTILSFKSPPASNMAFASAQTDGGASAAAFAVAGKNFHKPGKEAFGPGFPFKQRKR